MCDQDNQKCSECNDYMSLCSCKSYPVPDEIRALGSATVSSDSLADSVIFPAKDGASKHWRREFLKALDKTRPQEKARGGTGLFNAIESYLDRTITRMFATEGKEDIVHAGLLRLVLSRDEYEAKLSDLHDARDADRAEFGSRFATARLYLAIGRIWIDNLPIIKSITKVVSKWTGA